MTLQQNLEEFTNNYPFLTIASYAGNDYIGIIQNHDNNIISMYVYSNIKTKEEKEQFLRLGSDWWWSTNRTIPINIILGRKFHQFRYCLRTFNSKEFDIRVGPNLSLKNIITKRVKRKNIQLIRKEP